LALFNSIAVSDGDKYIPLKEMNLTHLGKVVYDAQMTIGRTLTYYCKLKAIESIEKSSCV
jgi:hypothetical protein